MLLVEAASFTPQQFHALFPKQKTSVLQQGVCPAAAGAKLSCCAVDPLLLPLEGTSSLQTVLRGQRGQVEGGFMGPPVLKAGF